MGGYDGGNSSHVKRMDFISDTSSTPPMTISHATTGMHGVANNNFGYAMGGFHGQGSNPPGFKEIIMNQDYIELILPRKILQFFLLLLKHILIILLYGVLMICMDGKARRYI